MGKAFITESATSTIDKWCRKRKTATAPHHTIQCKRIGKVCEVLLRRSFVGYEC